MPIDTTIPADGVEPEKSDFRANWTAIDSKIGLTTEAWTGLAGVPVVGDDTETSAREAQPGQSINWRGAILRNFGVLYSTFEPASYSPSSNAVALDFQLGQGIVITLTSSIASNGVTFANLPSGKITGGLIIIVQDGTGGRTIGGGSTVNAGFSSSNFDFGGINIALPSAANKEVWCSWGYKGSGKVQIREYLTGS